MNAPTPRLPFGPLLEALRVEDISALARRLHIEKSRPYRDERLGGLTPAAADRLAVAAGSHPALIWGDLWLNLPDDHCGLGWADEETHRAELRAKWAAKERRRRAAGKDTKTRKRQKDAA